MVSQMAEGPMAAVYRAAPFLLWDNFHAMGVATDGTICAFHL